MTDRKPQPWMRHVFTATTPQGQPTREYVPDVRIRRVATIAPDKSPKPAETVGQIRRIGQ